MPLKYKLCYLWLLSQLICISWLPTFIAGQGPPAPNCPKMGETECGCDMLKLLLPGMPYNADAHNLKADWIQIDDMVLPRPKQRPATAADNVAGAQSDPSSNTIKLWPGGIIFYIIDTAFKDSYKALIRESLAKMERQVGSDHIEFKEALSKTGKICRKNYVKFIKDDKNGCSAKLGMNMEGITEVWLDQAYCKYMFAIQHEVLHTLGRMHEQNRPDRDKHLKMSYEDILTSLCSNFFLPGPNTMDMSTTLPYDPDSIMHYDSCAGSCRGNYIMVKRSDGLPVGTNYNMSSMDVKKIRHMYPSGQKVTYSDRLCRDPGDNSTGIVVEEEPVVILVPRPRAPWNRTRYTDGDDDGVGSLRAWPVLISALAVTVAMAVAVATKIG